MKEPYLIIIVVLIGGPLDGGSHRIEPGFPIPNRLGIPDVERKRRHWYSIEDGIGYYDKSTPIKPVVDQ